MNAAAPSPAQDPLDAEIAAKEALVQRLERERAAALDDFDRQIAAAQVEVRLFRRAAELRPSTIGGLPPMPTWFREKQSKSFLGNMSLGRKGKPIGAINHKWRTILHRIVALGNDYLPPELWAVAAAECGIDIGEKAARDWLTRGAGGKSSYVERKDNGFRVSRLAIEKFGLKEPPLKEESGSDSPTKIGG